MRLDAAARALRRSPGTVVYGLVLLGTTAALAALDPDAGRRLVLFSSTNVDELARHPVLALATSAFWTPPLTEFAFALFLLAAVSAPLERRIGTLRWAGVLLAGHVGATLLTVAGTWAGIADGSLNPGVAHAADVGASYALLAAAGCLLLLVRRRLGLPLLALLAAALLGDIVVSGDFTSFGHLYALVIGCGAAGILRAPHASARRHALRIAGASALSAVAIVACWGLERAPSLGHTSSHIAAKTR